MEHIEIDWRPRLYGEGAYGPAVQPLLDWWEYMEQASSRLQKPIAYREDTEAMLLRIGFTDITHRIIPVQMQAAPGDARNFYLGQHFRDIMCMTEPNSTAPPSQAFEAMSLSLLTRQLGFDAGYVRSLCDVVKRICNSKQLPIYFNR